MNRFAKLCLIYINQVLIKWGIYFHLRRDVRIINRDGKLLNIGCGSNILAGFINCDIQSNHYHPTKKSNFVHYDMRKNELPFGDGEVDGIYCSHVLEHIESWFVKKFFAESLRVLKPGCVLRIVVPDPEFMFAMFHRYPEYFSWHKFYEHDASGLHSFVRLLSAAKSNEKDFGLTKKVTQYEYAQIMKVMRTEDFNNDHPERHINNWDFERIKKLATDTGFRDVINSKMQGSVSMQLQGADMDQTHPEMSLYIDLVK